MSIASTLIAVSLLTGGTSAGNISNEHVNRLMEGTGSVPVIRVSCSFKKFLSNPSACENDGGFSSASRSRDDDDDDRGDDDDDHGGDSDGDRGGDRDGDSHSSNDGRGHGDNDGDHGKDGDDD